MIQDDSEDGGDPNSEQEERLQTHLDEAQRLIAKANDHIEEARSLRFPGASSTRLRTTDGGDAGND